MKPIACYVAGVYSAPSAGDVERNVIRAIEIGDWLEDVGVRAFVPHLNHFRHRIRAREYEQWMEIDMFWLRRCDCLLRVPGVSPGADREVALAKLLGIPVFFSLREVADWMEQRSSVDKV